MGAAEQLITENLDVWTSAVKAKSSAGRGTGKKLELYGIQKLRELILELAVRGLLVPQDPDDDPALELVKRNAAERSKLKKEGKLKKQKKLADIGENDVPFAIPTSWEWVRLGNVTNYGVCDKAEASDVDGNTWVLELEDVEKSTSKLLKKIRFSERPFKSSKNCFHKSDVIYGKLRPYLDKVLVADEPGVCTTEMIPIRGFSSIDPAYLRLVMKSPGFIRYANESTHGMNLPRMGTDKARLAPIPLAPEPEQHRIVAKVDELMALCDRLEQEQESSLETHETLVATLLNALTESTASPEAFAEAWQRIQTHFDLLFTTESSIDHLKQTILQLAVMGKLVPQDPEDEPARELLQKIANEKAMLIKEGKIKKQKALPKVSDDDVAFEIPSCWAWCRFDDIIDQKYPIAYGVLVPGPHVDGGVPLVRVADLDLVSPNKAPEKSISIEVDSKFSRTRVMGGEIFMAVVGSIGKLGVAPDTWAGANIARALCRILPNSNVSKNYILLLLQTDFMQNGFKDDTRVLAQPTLNIGLIRSAVTPIPPLAEQHRIVAKVDKLMTICDQVKANIASAQTTQLNLADSLVNHATA